MGRACLKNTGKILFSLFCLIPFLPSGASAAQVRTELQSSRVSVGERTILQITITGVSDAEPRTLPKISGLQISFQGTQHFSSMKMMNWKVQRESGIHLMFAVIPQRSGTFKIPKIRIKSGAVNLSSQSVSLIAVKGTTNPQEGAPRRMLSDVTLERNNVYVGEPIILRYAILHSGIRLAEELQFEKMPESKGFVQKVIAETIQDSIFTKDNIQFVKTHAETFVLIPTLAGTFTINGGTLYVSYIPSRHYPFSRKMRLKYDPASVTVKELPSDGKPADFHGNVGVFSMDSKMDNTPLAPFEEKHLTISIKGHGNLISLSKPKLANDIKNIKIICEEREEKLAIENGELRGEKTYFYTLIPEKSGTINIGTFIFNFFNVKTGQYETLSSKDITLEITGKSKPQSQLKLEEKDPDTFTDVNIIVILLIIATITVLVGAVILWERKRFSVASGTLSTTEPVQEPESNKSMENNYFREMLSALRNKDSALFMTASENIIRNRINGHGQILSGNAEKIKGIKERLYNCKYGGEQISEDDMENIYQEIKKLLD